MIMTPANTSVIGKPARIFDAKGNYYPRVKEANTETGEIIQWDDEMWNNYLKENPYKTDKDKEDEYFTKTTFAPAPLRIEYQE